MPSDSPVDWNSLVTLPRSTKTVVVLDLVESVRLMEQNEVDTVHRWQAVQTAVGQAVAEHQGRLVKSLGDGVMLEFDQPQTAAHCALAVQAAMPRFSQGYAEDRHMLLRAGIHTAQIYTSALDIYGSGVNLAARLATLAGPGEIVVSAEVRDGLTDGLDGTLEDLGECYLKHVHEPVRAYRVGPAGREPVLHPFREYDVSLEPTIAVIPLALLQTDGDHSLALGDAIADDIIAALSKSTSLRVISRLSTAPFRGGKTELKDVRALLGAAYFVSGSYSVHGGKTTVRVELCAARDGSILWADGISANVADLFHGQDTVVPTIAANIGRVVLQSELKRARALPISTLEAYTLYVSGIALLHRLSRADFLYAGELLEYLSYRHPRSAAPQAMLAKWHMLQAVQGWSPDPAVAGAKAIQSAQRALELEPDNAMALAMRGILSAHFEHDLQSARHYSLAAIHANPQEPHGWLHLAAADIYLEETELVGEHAARPLHLSPLDPARFGFEVFLCASHLVRGKFQEAIASARSSIRLNALHPASHRLLTISQVISGDLSGARESAKGLMRADPSFSVSKYARHYPGRAASHAAVYLDALRQAGAPA